MAKIVKFILGLIYKDNGQALVTIEKRTKVLFSDLLCV